MKHVSFFAGIGGFEEGLRGISEPAAFSEIAPFAIRVFKKNHGPVPNLGDVHALDSWDSLPALQLRSAWEKQQAGPLAGPVLLLENVPAWRRGGLQRVLGDLASIGFDAEWFTLCACLVGAPHHRPRVFVLAYPNGQGEPFSSIHEEVAGLCEVSGSLPWPSPPRGLGVADGVPERVHRLRALGNSVVPAVVRWIGQRVSAVMGESE